MPRWPTKSAVTSLGQAIKLDYNSPPFAFFIILPQTNRMCMWLWKPILRLRARDITFKKASLELSEETYRIYDAIKVQYTHLAKSLSNFQESDEMAPHILKEFLALYLKGETLALSLFNEIFKPHFVETLEQRRSVFELLNKLMKIFMAVDCLRLKYPEAFCHYSFFKMRNPENIYGICSEYEDQRMSILGSIALPMGRLVLSLFSTNKFELYYPTILSKRTRIHMNAEMKKTLYMYARLSEIHEFKYLYMYLGAVYKRFYGKGSYTYDRLISPSCEKYLEMLQQHV